MLLCTTAYENEELEITAKPGDTLRCAPLLEEQLLREAPDCWEARPNPRRGQAPYRVILSVGERTA